MRASTTCQSIKSGPIDHISYGNLSNYLSLSPAIMDQEQSNVVYQNQYLSNSPVFFDQQVSYNYQAEEAQRIIDNNCRFVFERLKSDREERRRAHRKLMKSSYSRSSSRMSSSSGRRRFFQEDELPRRGAQYLVELENALTSYGNQLGCGLAQATGGRYLNLDRALVHLSFASQDYETVHSLIRQMGGAIPVSLEQEIEELWDNSTYHIIGQKGQILNSVNRYRLRNRLKCPTIERSGGKKYKISPRAKAVLWEQFNANSTPTRDERDRIIRETGLSKETICNWFKNRRQRAKIGKLEKDDKVLEVPAIYYEQDHSLSETSSMKYYTEPVYQLQSFDQLDQELQQSQMEVQAFVPCIGNGCECCNSFYW